MNCDPITFKRTDDIPYELEAVILDFVMHFEKKRAYIEEFCDLIRKSSRWNTDTMSQDIAKWSRLFLNMYAEEQEIVDLVTRAFTMCRSKNYINKLRGLLVEALVMAAHGGYERYAYGKSGWGAEVTITESNYQVVYNCPKHMIGDCHHRSTVDFGIWMDNRGGFYECKVLPDKIGCKEFNYMQVLKEELEKKNINFDIYFACPVDEDEIGIQLKLSGYENAFLALGMNRFKRLLSA